jgi:hypothetical protein
MQINKIHPILTFKQISIYLLFSILLSPLNLLALVEDNALINYFQPNKVVYVFNDQTNLLSESRPDSNIIHKLTIDTELTIEEETTERILYTQHNMELPWLKVSLTNNNKKTTGYVWVLKKEF